MEIPIKLDDFGGKTHYFRKHPYNPIELNSEPQNKKTQIPPAVA